MPKPRRWIALGLALAAGLLTGSAPIASPAKDRLTLLGTGGGPIARIGRSQPSSMLETGGKTYLIDIGAGTERQVVRAGLRLNRVDGVFITHLHFDHTAGLAAFIALDWQDRRREPVAVHGPPGTRELVANALRFLGSGEAIFRPQLPDLGPIAGLFSGTDHEVTAPAPIFSDGRLTVRAVENSHYGTMHLVPAITAPTAPTPIASTRPNARSCSPAIPARAKRWSGWARTPTCWSARSSTCR